MKQLRMEGGWDCGDDAKDEAMREMKVGFLRTRFSDRHLPSPHRHHPTRSHKNNIII